MRDNFKSKLKGFFVGIIVSSVLFTGIPCFGESITQTIEVSFNTVNLKVNGKSVQADNILYNDTTYIPIRAVAEMLEKDVSWDEGTNTANIKDKYNNPAKTSDSILPSVNPDVLEKVPKEVHIKGAYWGGDSNIPKDFSKHLSSSDFAFITDAWENTKDDFSISPSIIDAFQQLSDREFTLSADGHPDVIVSLSRTGSYGTTPTENSWETVWKISVPEDSLKNIASGVKYKITPSNKSEYKWIVDDGVCLVKP